MHTNKSSLPLAGGTCSKLAMGVPSTCKLAVRTTSQVPLYSSMRARESRLARQAKFSHALVWPLELGLRTPTLQCGHLSGPSRTRRGFFDFEVGGHDGTYKGRVHVIVPFVGRKNAKSFDCQQSYNVLVLRVAGLEEGVMFGGKAL